jgi:hypothetical protein
LDRLARSGEITDDEYEAKLAQVDEMLAEMIVLPITPDELQVASRRFGVRVDTLDAIHLATTLQYRAAHSDEIAPLFATHDHTLATAARAFGFDVIGSN